MLSRVHPYLLVSMLLSACVVSGNARSNDSGTPSDAQPEASMDAAPPVNCGVVTNCTTCAALGACGWCGATNACVASTASGTCASGWANSVAACPATPEPAPEPAVTDAAVDPCASNLTCGTCTAEGACGFCQATGRCQTGGRDAPTMGPACPSGWAWLSSTCASAGAEAGTDAGDPCASATDCAACTQRSQCGWCPGSNRCLLGTSSGPGSDAGTCGSWAWYSGQCGGGTDAATADGGDPCASATTCSACTARLDCGWCPGANRCVVGSYSGPSGTVAACGTWAWVASACGADAGSDAASDAPSDAARDAGTDARTDAGQGTGTVPGFGDPTTFNSADVARACPAGATLRLSVARIYAAPRKPNGSPWDGIPGLSDFVCAVAADQIRTALRDQLNNASMGLGDTADGFVGDAFHNIVASQCGTSADWFLGRWEGPDMFAQLFSPAGSSVSVWTTPTESDSWEAPRTGASWSTAYVDIPCSALGGTLYGLDVRDYDPIPPNDAMGVITFRGSQVTPRALCSGFAFHEGVDGIAGVLFTTRVTGGTQNCTGLR